ncbi:Helicase C-terminal domain-containing protein [Mycena sanguinolenta]|uniref:Helicase C-terminal domain-containing protein n=1 Tax=Mycena sanguinolenta TaxID=230812 RepID=A0A8H7D9U2_9AGAR|nr:Helicase C-terminal domain-containing protein [Mycena sanguinolenta]
MASPWTLDSYLSYGFLAISLLDTDEVRPQMQDQKLAEDGWHTFTGYPLLEYTSHGSDHDVLRNLDFLISNKFVFASFLLADNWLFIRIYLIPYDLPGVKGELRNRPEPIVTHARRCLAEILPKLSRDPECWAGYNVPDTPLNIPGTTLSGLYEDLPSPDGLVTAASTPITKRLLDFSDTLDNLGIRTEPYRYQRRTVAAMIQKEMDLKDDPDPLFLPVTGMNKKQFFFQPGTLEVLLERPLVAPCRGGILCEELGTGKTLMILALILSTRRQLSEPEPSILDARPVLTPLAFRHFPSGEFADARERFSRNTYKCPNLNPTPSRVPTLVELLLHRMATHPITFVPESQTHCYARLEEDLENLDQYTSPLNDNLPFYFDYGQSIDDERASKRRAPVQSGPRLLYLSVATLVVVPSNLLLQWENECSLHCEDSLRRCVIRKDKPVPPARVLAKYDIVLIGDTLCGYRNACASHHPRSPLLHVRWKRFVIDEGHVSASFDSVLMHFARSLSVERRWIVTGTPTTNLLGLNLGKTINEDAAVRQSEVNAVLLSRTPSEDFEIDDADDSASTVPRVWTKDGDAVDLMKLGNMISYFIGVPQFLANSKLFDSHVKAPLLDARGPRPGAVEVLMQLMSSVMFRHRIADVEQEVKLPPVTQELVLLDLDPLVVKSYNAFQAGIAINAVTSERKDQDYMFHSENLKSLRAAIVNMSQLMFWSVDDNLYNSKESLETADEKRKKLSPTTSLEDLKLLEDAFHHLSHMTTHFGVPYKAMRMCPIVSIISSSQSSRRGHELRIPSIPKILFPLAAVISTPDRLRELKNLVLQQSLISQDALIREGIHIAERDAKQKAEYQASLKHKKSSKNSHGHDDRANQKATKASKTVKEVEKELKALRSDSPPPAHNDNHRPSALVAKSHIAKTRLGCSASSKLNFIIDEVLKYSSTEKFLIFSDSPLSLAHIGEALELLGVDYLRFTTQISAEGRKQFVLTFETSEKYRVFLMELRHGARGLNLISASRVIFCEPVWRADVESQAIKRAHRMGQTRPITVKTLAIRGTAEENMAARRLALEESSEKIPKIEHESGMRAFIANPKFLTQTPTVLPIIEFPLVKLAAPDNDEDTAMTEVEIESRQARFASGNPLSSVKRPLDAAIEDSPTRKIRLLSLLPSEKIFI